MFLDNLKMHFDYIPIVKVRALEKERLPRIVLTHIIRTRGGRVQEWERLASDCGLNRRAANISTNEIYYFTGENWSYHV